MTGRDCSACFDLVHVLIFIFAFNAFILFCQAIDCILILFSDFDILFSSGFFGLLGRQLTAVILPEKEIVQVDALRVYQEPK